MFTILQSQSLELVTIVIVIMVDLEVRTKRGSEWGVHLSFVG